MKANEYFPYTTRLTCIYIQTWLHTKTISSHYQSSVLYSILLKHPLRRNHDSWFPLATDIHVLQVIICIDAGVRTVMILLLMR